MSRRRRNTQRPPARLPKKKQKPRRSSCLTAIVAKAATIRRTMARTSPSKTTRPTTVRMEKPIATSRCACPGSARRTSLFLVYQSRLRLVPDVLHHIRMENAER